MKLHLGCGEIYLKGYVNIDYPPSEHTAQLKSVADEYHDITKLRYPKGSIEEIRLHHVFEHFPRAIALALLISWRSWLKPGGILRIAVPDFDRTALAVLNPFSSVRNRRVGLRHIFGSNEASWAVHYEGWSPKRMGAILKLFGFDVVTVKKQFWKGTFSFDLTARKNFRDIPVKEAEKLVKTFLSDHIVNMDAPSERRILEVWMETYRDQIKKALAH